MKIKDEEAFIKRLVNAMQERNIIYAQRDPSSPKEAYQYNDGGNTPIHTWLNMKDEHIFQRTHDGWIRCNSIFVEKNSEK